MSLQGLLSSGLYPRMKGLEPFQHLPPRNAGNRPPLEPWQNMVLVVVHVDSERARFPVPPVIGEHLVGDLLESDLCRLWGDTLPPFPNACQQGSRLRPGLGFGQSVGIADLCPASPVDGKRKLDISGNRKLNTLGVGAYPQAGVGLGGAVGNWLGDATADESGGDKPVIHSGRAARLPFWPATTTRPSCGADPSRPAAGSDDRASCNCSRGC